MLYKYYLIFLVIFILCCNYIIYMFYLNNSSTYLTQNEVDNNDIIITSSLIGNMRFYLSLNLNKQKQIISKNHINYANKFNYKYLEYGKTLFNKDAKWEKIYIIRELLKTDTKYILWIDGDTGFIDCNKDIQDIIKEYDSDIIISGDHNFVINSGVFVIKNTKWSKNFIDDMIFIVENKNIQKEIQKYTNLHDQSAFIPLIMGYNPLFEPEKIGYYFNKGSGKSDTLIKEIPQKIKNHVNIIPRQIWNSYYKEKNPFILHCAGDIFCKTYLHNIIKESSTC